MNEKRNKNYNLFEDEYGTAINNILLVISLILAVLSVIGIVICLATIGNYFSEWDNKISNTGFASLLKGYSRNDLYYNTGKLINLSDDIQLIVNFTTPSRYGLGNLATYESEILTISL